jgi:hypothetical protein
MGFKLPELRTDVDCGPLGYPKLVFRFFLNAVNPEEDDQWVEPDKRDPPVEDPDPWDRAYYQAMGRVLECVIIPGKFSTSGKEETIEIPDARAYYDLELMPGFEQGALVWAINTFHEERQERLQVAAKN